MEVRAKTSAAVVLAIIFLVIPFGSRAAADQVPCASHGTYTVGVPGAPISAVATSDEQHVFVALNFTNPTQPNGIEVLACQAGRYVPQRFIGLENQPTIMALTHDGKTLIVPDDNFIAFVDVSRALAGDAGAVIGYIEDIAGDDGGAVYAAVSPDDRYGFVAEEQSGKLTVVDLRELGKPGFGHSAIVSEFLVGNAPVALVFSQDGKHLFVTAQVALKRYQFAHTCKSQYQGEPDESPGAIATLDVSRAVSDPDHAIVSYTAAACHPVRASLSPDGRTLWVTARASNAVLAFSTDKLIGGQSDAKILETKVGPAPVPIVATSDGRYVLAANRNRFAPGQSGDQAIEVIDAHDGSIKRGLEAGKFPRQFAQTRSGSAIFLCNYGSGTVLVIDPTQL